MTVDVWYQIRSAMTHNQTARLARAVTTAQRQGAKWAEIAKAAGKSKTTVQRRISAIA